MLNLTLYLSNLFNFSFIIVILLLWYKIALPHQGQTYWLQLVKVRINRWCFSFNTAFTTEFEIILPELNHTANFVTKKHSINNFLHYNSIQGRNMLYELGTIFNLEINLSLRNKFQSLWNHQIVKNKDFCNQRKLPILKCNWKSWTNFRCKIKKIYLNAIVMTFKYLKIKTIKILYLYHFRNMKKYLMKPSANIAFLIICKVRDRVYA